MQNTSTRDASRAHPARARPARAGPATKAGISGFRKKNARSRSAQRVLRPCASPNAAPIAKPPDEQRRRRHQQVIDDRLGSETRRAATVDERVSRDSRCSRASTPSITVPVRGRPAPAASAARRARPRWPAPAIRATTPPRTSASNSHVRDVEERRRRHQRRRASPTAAAPRRARPPRPSRRSVADPGAADSTIAAATAASPTIALRRSGRLVSRSRPARCRGRARSS